MYKYIFMCVCVYMYIERAREVNPNPNLTPSAQSMLHIYIPMCRLLLLPTLDHSWLFLINCSFYVLMHMNVFTATVFTDGSCITTTRAHTHKKTGQTSIEDRTFCRYAVHPARAS